MLYTTNLVGSFTFNNLGRTIQYTYDASGNIATRTDTTNDGSTTTEYFYDELNQLKRENDPVANKTTTYLYDNGGNILEKREYTYVAGNTALGTLTDTITYTYDDPVWKDLLKEYDGCEIGYDNIGNPTTFNGATLTWERGRKLSSYTKADGTAITYKYDANGIRTQKTVGGVTTDYFLQGSTIVAQKTGNNVIWYYFDGDGTRDAIEYNGTVYYYMYNPQGDVIGLFNDNLDVVVEYAYDSWGNVLSITGSHASTLGQDNPFRYRGYYYDNETGMYYLNSRYYHPQIGRFINADTITDGGSGIIGTNLFVYAANNPVTNADPSGNWIIKDAIKWVAKNVVKPLVDSARKSLAKTSKTYSCGINFSGTPSAFSFNGQIGFSADTSGNVAIQKGYSGGVTGGTPGVSLSGYRMRTNAPSIKKLEGLGAQTGGTVCVYNLVVGIDFNIIPDELENKTYFGITETIGIGTNGAEMHVEWGETDTLEETKFNVFDELDKVYIKIMEW